MLVDKLNEFKAAVDAIKVAIAAQGVAVSAYTLASAASLVGQVKTSRSMGSKSITFKQNTVIYGFKITENEMDPEKRVTHLDDAVGMVPVSIDKSSGTGEAIYNGWDKTWIFDKIYPVMLSGAGSFYKLDPHDQTKEATYGYASGVANINENYNAMVCVEKFYTKFSMNGDNEEIRISNTPQDGFEAIGFIREDGSEADRIFLPMFMGCFDSNNKLRSVSGQDVKYSTLWSEFRTAAQKNGSGYDIESYAMNQIMGAVYMILMKNCNSETAIRSGRKAQDAKTGVLVNKGAIAYDQSTNAAKFMWIEDFTSAYFKNDGMFRFETGILSRYYKVYVKMKPPYSTEITDYDEITDIGHIDNYYWASAMKCSNEFGRYPTAGNGRSNMYECICHWVVEGANHDVGVAARGEDSGVWGHYVSFWSNGIYSRGQYRGAALTYLPPK